MDRVEQSGPGSIGDDEIVAVLDEHREQHLGGCQIDHPTSVCLKLASAMRAIASAHPARALTPVIVASPSDGVEIERDCAL